MTALQLDRILSPMGELLLVTDEESVWALDFVDYEPRMMAFLRKRTDRVALKKAVNPLGLRDRLTDYFDGRLNSFHSLAVNPGGTAFQQQVWCALQTITPGRTCTYGDLAKSIGNPNASRAVGSANRLNPIAIVIPCHRVIGSNNQLTGYAGGLNRKDWLLRHEKQWSGTPQYEQASLFS